MAATISTEGLVWIGASSGESVPGAIVGGSAEDGAELHIIRVEHKSELAVGKLHLGHSHAYVAYFGKEHSHEDYEVLANPGDVELEWVSACSGEVPTGAVVGGRCGQDTPIYVARCHHEQDIVPAKLVVRCEGAFVPWGGEEHHYKEYEVLCVKSVNPQGQC